MQQSFLTETVAINFVEQLKKNMDHRFVPESDHVQELVILLIFSFPLPYLRDHGLLRSRNFATMAT